MELEKGTIEYFEHKLLSRIAHYGRLSRHVLRAEEGKGYGDGDYEIRVEYKLYTNEHVYAISAVETPDISRTYLGCIMGRRKSNPGERHTRGRDLSDGKLTDETWMSIMGDIISIEMQELDIQKGCMTDLDFKWTEKESEKTLGLCH